MMFAARVCARRLNDGQIELVNEPAKQTHHEIIVLDDSDQEAEYDSDIDYLYTIQPSNNAPRSEILILDDI